MNEVYVTCCCGKVFEIDRDVLRAILDADKQPVCKRCSQPRKPAATVKPGTAVATILATLDEPATLSQIIIAAWETDQMKFGLPGFEDIYPDSNRVSAAISKMLRDGLVEKTAPRTYRKKVVDAKEAAG